MKNIFNISKCGVAMLLTLGILLGIAGISVHATAMAEEKPIATEENTPELMPVMARACFATLDDGLNRFIGKNNWEYDENGSPQAKGFKIYVSNGYCRVTGDDVTYSFRFG